ncbi:PREDICTED: E3 ubiquitin-protein ligase DZIP3-like [Branchiostoma belcheri]|uniref:E3 ubiquitin-protein ligase DZIP3-like n=1 Tax=Branchiostoma belcheri TaxID=7741 RepID=A0A6P5APF5_BRABE|nr:PREDICTED: E3 ubiquitin-protein ligase DZIP3-like [Branchiostoma belcheri]
MATGGDPYTPETANGARLQALLIDEGTKLVRKVFDQEVSRMKPPNFQEQLRRNRQNFTDPVLGILNFDQQKTVYPSPGTAADSSEHFDIALLSLLLGILCNVKPPKTGWNKEPPEGDKSPIAWIIRLRLFRNRNYGHITDTALSNTKFKKLWKELADILIGLGGDKDQIQKRKSETIDPKMAKTYQEKFEKLHKEENEVKDLLTAQHNEVLETLGSLEKKIEEGMKDILDGQKAIITEVEKQSRLSDTEGNQEDKTPIQDNPNTDEQVADGVRSLTLSDSGISLGDSETEQGNVVGQPSSVEATIQQPRSSGTGNSDISEVDGKKYDFGILCTKADESWTEKDIVNKLEQKKLEGYFPCRDDIGGDSVFQYLSIGIENSRNIIIVYSPSTISDEWFKIGYQTAVVEKLDKNLIGRVIPVLRKGFTGDKLPIELKTFTPLQGDNPNFFKRLEKSLNL